MRLARTALAAVLSFAAAREIPAATLEGKVVHAEQPSAEAFVALTLLGVRRNGEAIERTARSDASGAFRFEDLPADAAYLLFGEHAGIRFYGGTTVLRAEDAGAIRSTTLRIHERSDDPSGLEIRSLAVALEREAGTWRAKTAATLSNPTLRAIAIDDSKPAPLRLGLLPGAREPRSPFGDLPPGARVEDGSLALRGPFLPGEQEFAIEYEIDAPAEALTGAIPVPNAIESFELRVRDFGVAVEAGALHPARPTKEDDEVWMRWLGFDLVAGQELPLALRPLAPRTPLPRSAHALLVALLGGLLFLFVVRPLGGARTEQRAADDGSAPDPERDALFSALRDLEHDFETGKLSPEDRERMRAELRDDAAQALAARRGERASVAVAPATLAAARTCDCGREAAAGDRFCAACGKPL